MVQACPEFIKWNQVLVDGLRRLPLEGLRCQCIVGSHLTATGLKAVHDVDVCAVVAHIGRQNLLEYWACAEELASELSSPTVRVLVETRSGPLKPDIPIDGHTTIQLHLVVYDLSTWTKVIRYPGCNRWTRQNFRLRGTQLCDLVPVPRVSTEAICRDLAVAIGNVRSSAAYCRIYDVSAESITSEMRRVPLSSDQYIQMVLQSAILGFENVTDPAMGGRKLRVMATELYGRYSALVDRCRMLKIQLDRGMRIPHDEVEEVRDEILVMLLELVETAKCDR